MPAELSYFCTALSGVGFNKIPLVSCQPVQSVPRAGQEPFLNGGLASLPHELPSQRNAAAAGVAWSTGTGHCFAKELSITVQHSPRWDESLPTRAAFRITRGIQDFSGQRISIPFFSHFCRVVLPRGHPECVIHCWHNSPCDCGPFPCPGWVRRGGEGTQCPLDGQE